MTKHFVLHLCEHISSITQWYYFSYLNCNLWASHSSWPNITFHSLFFLKSRQDLANCSPKHINNFKKDTQKNMQDKMLGLESLSPSHPLLVPPLQDTTPSRFNPELILSLQLGLYGNNGNKMVLEASSSTRCIIANVAEFLLWSFFLSPHFIYVAGRGEYKEWEAFGEWGRSQIIMYLASGFDSSGMRLVLHLMLTLTCKATCRLRLRLTSSSWSKITLWKKAGLCLPKQNKSRVFCRRCYLVAFE